ncbi:MAG TPA: hypothetical protein VMK12_14155, partial [Anaeromyxobacteraceae bacterium]|nr:hypothetical protein [Anaeromyxobacteraceae bacterium]
MADWEAKAKELRQLIEGMGSRREVGDSLAAKVRELMPVIDRRLRQGGVRHEDVVAVLNAHGDFPRPLRLQHFRRILARFRKTDGSVPA